MIRSGLCIGCGACATSGEDMRWNGYRQLEPGGTPAWRRAPDARLARICPFSPIAANEDAIATSRFADAPVADPRLGRFEAAYVGHVAEGAFRAQGSSGGLVTWVASELLRTGAVDAVAHVAPAAPQGGVGYFGYSLSRDAEALLAGAKSRYHPVTMAEILAQIRATPGRYAIVGIPCFIKAVHLLRAEEPLLAERIVATLGLFCGHMKSARFVESFAWQLGVPSARVAAVDYRRKDAGRPANWYTADLTLDDGTRAWRDWFHLADGDWGAGFFQSAACNMCDDVVAETADVSFGDAWIEPYSSDGRGTNVAIVRSPTIASLVRAGIEGGRLALEPMDAEQVAFTQAAGLRMRREGLAYRLTWARRGVRPAKRVAPSAHLPRRRKVIYRVRAAITRGSHPVAALAHRLGRPGLYLAWARLMGRLYHGVAYGSGWIARLLGPTRSGPA